jgi:hypothetical protein
MGIPFQPSKHATLIDGIHTPHNLTTHHPATGTIIIRWRKPGDRAMGLDNGQK